MAVEKKTATFGIKIDTETDADKSRLSVEELGKQIKASQDAVKAYGASLRNLRGTSDEVAEAKKKLKAAVAAERDQISQGVLALGKHGKTLQDVTQKTKAAKLPVDQLKSSLGEMKATLAGLGILAVTGTIVGLGVAAYETGKKLAGFVLENADLLRTQGLLREAATGSAENARAFGNQIDALADKIPTARNELQELSLDLSKSLIGTRISGQGIVDTFNAIAQAGAALGKGAGSRIEEIITRGKNVGRFSLGRQELMGSGAGIGFEDVSKALAKNLKIGLGDAQRQLQFGRVKIEDGAKAVRDAIEGKFANVNTRQMLSLTTIWQKFKDNLTRLTADVKLEPILNGVKRLADLFSETTVTGDLLKTAISGFGTILGLTFTRGVPTAERYVKQIVNQILRWELYMLKNKKSIVDMVGTALEKLKILGAAFNAVVTGVNLVSQAIYELTEGWKQIDFGFIGDQFRKGLKDLWNESDLKAFVDIGAKIIDGMIQGLKAGWGRLKAGVLGAVTKVKEYFTGPQGIDAHSPSKLFEKYGQQSTEGYAQGLERGAPAAGVAAQGVIPRAPQVSGSSIRAGASIGSVRVSVNVSFPGVTDGAGASAALSGPTFKAQLTAALEDILRGAGLPPQTPQAEVT